MNEEKGEDEMENKRREYGRRAPIHSVRAFLSSDDRYVVVQNIETTAFPINYLRTIMDCKCAKPLAKPKAENAGLPGTVE